MKILFILLSIAALNAIQPKGLKADVTLQSLSNTDTSTRQVKDPFRDLKSCPNTSNYGKAIKARLLEYTDAFSLRKGLGLLMMFCPKAICSIVSGETQHMDAESTHPEMIPSSWRGRDYPIEAPDMLAGIIIEF